MPQPALKLETARKAVRVESFDGDVYLNLGIYAVAGNRPFEVRAYRFDYGQPINAWSVLPGADAPLPPGSATDFNGLSDFFTVLITNSKQKSVVNLKTSFCPNGDDPIRRRPPWYSAAASPGLVASRDFGFFACFLRLGDKAYETYWTTDRGNEAPSWSYVLMDRTIYGRQEPWEDSPHGWPQHVGQRHETFGVAGRPAVQWHYLDEPDRHQPSQG